MHLIPELYAGHLERASFEGKRIKSSENERKEKYAYMVEVYNKNDFFLDIGMKDKKYLLEDSTMEVTSIVHKTQDRRCRM